MSLNPFTTHWYYNDQSGELTNAPNIEGIFESGIAGWHELNIPGSATKAQAQAEAAKEFPKATPPTTSLSQGAANEVSQIPGVSAISSVADFLQGLTSANLWIRVAKVTIGGALILVGVAKLTGAENAVSRTVKKMPIIPL